MLEVKNWHRHSNTVTIKYVCGTKWVWKLRLDFLHTLKLCRHSSLGGVRSEISEAVCSVTAVLAGSRDQVHGKKGGQKPRTCCAPATQQLTSSTCLLVLQCIWSHGGTSLAYKCPLFTAKSLFKWVEAGFSYVTLWKTMYPLLYNESKRWRQRVHNIQAPWALAH